MLCNLIFSNENLQILRGTRQKSTSNSKSLLFENHLDSSYHFHGDSSFDVSANDASSNIFRYLNRR